MDYFIKLLLLRIAFVFLCIIIGLFVGGVVEVWLGALYGTVIGIVVGIVVPVIWGLMATKLNNRQESSNLLAKTNQFE